MKISEMFMWIFSIFVFLLLPSIDGTSPAEDVAREVAIEGRTIAHCDDLPRSATLYGDLTIAGDINCGNDFKRIHITGDSVIRRVRTTTNSRQTTAIKTTNVIWVVDAGAYATFVAPSVTISRNEGLADGIPLVHVHATGIVDFQVYGRYKSLVGESKEDKHGIVTIKRGGDMRTGKFMSYSRNSIVAANAGTRSGEDKVVPTTEIQPVSPFRGPPLDEAKAPLEVRYAISDINDATLEGEGSPATTQQPGGNDDVRTFSSGTAAVVDNDAGNPNTTVVGTDRNEGVSPTDSDAQSAAPAAGGGGDPSAPPEKPDHDTATAAVEDGSGKANIVEKIVEGTWASNVDATSVGDGGHTGDGGGARTVTGDGAGPDISSTTPKDITATNNPDAHDPPASLSGADGEGHTVEAPLDRADANAADRDIEALRMRSRWTSRSSRGYTDGIIDPRHPLPSYEKHKKGENGGRFYSSPSCLIPNEGPVKVEKPWSARLYSDDVKRSSYVDILGAAVVHTRKTGEDPLDAHGRQVGAAPSQTVTLAEPNRKKMAMVFRNREDIDAEDAEVARVANGGRVSMIGKMVKALLGLLPVGKHGFVRKRQRRIARAHRGEMEAELTDRGQLEVSLDGMTVLRMPGSKPWSRLPPRDPSFELGVTDEGLEVTRGEDVVWEGKKNFV